MKTFTLTLAALAVLASAASATPAASVKAAPAKKAALVCPVTGEAIASAAEACDHETYKRKTYYFCCPMCRPRFDKNPAKIAADAANGKYQPM